MFKIASTIDPEGLREARGVLNKIYEENPSYWPYGLSPEHFDGGLYLVQTKEASKVVGFVGWQERRVPVKTASRFPGRNFEKVGYYSIGILPEFRRNGFAKQAISSLLSIKSAGVDRVEALIMDSNTPSKALAKRLGVQMRIKKADVDRGAVVGGAVGASLPAASLLQYRMSELPMIRQRFQNANYMTLPELTRQARPGMVGLQTMLHTDRIGNLPVEAIYRGGRAVSGEPMGHAVGIGYRGKVYHGGDMTNRRLPVGDWLTNRAMGLAEAAEATKGNKLRALITSDFWNRAGKAIAKYDNSVAAKSHLVDRMAANILRDTYAGKTTMLLDPTNLSATGRATMIDEMRRMGPKPYSATRGILGGLGNVLFPHLPNTGRGKAQICNLNTSMCGELPAAALKSVGLHSGPVAGSLPSSLLLNPNLQTVGVAARGVRPQQLKRMLLARLAQTAKTRTQVGLGAAALAGLGGAGLGHTISQQGSK